MLAKLIFYPENSVQEACLDALSSEPTNKVCHYQWTTDSLTTGKMIDLLVYLDELGFLSVDADMGRLIDVHQ